MVPVGLVHLAERLAMQQTRQPVCNVRKDKVITGGPAYIVVFMGRRPSELICLIGVLVGTVSSHRLKAIFAWLVSQLDSWSISIRLVEGLDTFSRTLQKIVTRD